MNFAHECMKRLLGLFALLACVASGSVCHAQLDVVLDTATVSFGTLDKSSLDAGFMELTAVVPTYALRVAVTDTVPQNWTLSTKVSASYFTAAFGTKPCGDLQWRLNGGGNYTPYTIFDVPAATGNGNATIDFDFKMLTSWTDEPDTYSITVVYTISGP